MRIEVSSEDEYVLVVAFIEKLGPIVVEVCDLVSLTCSHVKIGSRCNYRKVCRSSIALRVPVYGHLDCHFCGVSGWEPLLPDSESEDVRHTRFDTFISHTTSKLKYRTWERATVSHENRI